MSDPVSWLLVERGWEVVDCEGGKVGQVEEVLGDMERDIFDGLAVATGLVGKPKYVPSERVAGIFEGRIALDLARDEVDQLDETR